MREDAANETDLVSGGYRDRLLTELAQNAADAATREAEIPRGHLRVWLDADHLHVANTGAPLEASGVEALAALRASSKTSGVGQFGVGFTAVRSVSDEIEIRSTTGSIRFSADGTAEELRRASLPTPKSGVPVLRLVWPTSAAPIPEFDSEIVLTLRPDIDGGALVHSMESEAIGLLLELDGLESIEVDGSVFQREVVALENGLDEISIGPKKWWQRRCEGGRWLVPVVGETVSAVSLDVLRAPTRSDEELSLPAIVVTDVPMQPDRRRIVPGANISRIAEGYADFVRRLPATQRAALVPRPGFARSEVDSMLRESILRELMAQKWLPGVGDTDLIPTRATVLTGLTDALADLLVDVVPGLVIPELSGPRDAPILAALDVHRIGLAHVADLLSGLAREPQWWRQVYAALEPLVIDGVAAEELASIPVPLSDGRTVTGPRTTVLGMELGVESAEAVHWARLVHPGAAHPLLARLGAGTAHAVDLLSDPNLEAELDNLADGDVDDDGIVDAVLRLATRAVGEQMPSWLGSLPLRDIDGQVRAADELLLPGAPLAAVLAPDSPFNMASPDLVNRYGEGALRAVGVGWGFSLVREDMPTGPDHDLDDETSWWASLRDEPAELVAVRDLDLIDDSKWVAALDLLLTDQTTRELLGDRDGYTAWWLRTHAVIDGHSLGEFRSPSDDTFAGLLDALDHSGASALSAALSPARIDTLRLAQLLIDRLGDDRRTPTPAVIASTHHLLSVAIESGRIDVADLDLPDRVRTIAGSVVDPLDALVLDKPWFAAVVPIDRAVFGSFDSAAALADALDVRLASQSVRGEVLGTGLMSSWDREPGAVLACAALGLPLPVGAVMVHQKLTVRLTGAIEADRDVAWWVGADGLAHCDPTWNRPRAGF